MKKPAISTIVSGIIIVLILYVALGACSAFMQGFHGERAQSTHERETEEVNNDEGSDSDGATDTEGEASAEAETQDENVVENAILSFVEAYNAYSSSPFEDLERSHDGKDSTYSGRTYGIYCIIKPQIDSGLLTVSISPHHDEFTSGAAYQPFHDVVKVLSPETPDEDIAAQWEEALAKDPSMEKIWHRGEFEGVSFVMDINVFVQTQPDTIEIYQSSK